MDTTKIVALFDNLVTIGTIVGIPACAFFFAWGAFKYMSAGGSPRGMESGKTAMTNALMGLAGVMLATVVANLVGGALK